MLIKSTVLIRYQMKWLAINSWVKVTNLVNNRKITICLEKKNIAGYRYEEHHKNRRRKFYNRIISKLKCSTWKTLCFVCAATTIFWLGLLKFRSKFLHKGHFSVWKVMFRILWAAIMFGWCQCHGGTMIFVENERDIKVVKSVSKLLKVWQNNTRGIFFY